MKKLFAVIAIAGVLVACGDNSSEGTENTMADTTTLIQPDTMQVVTDTSVSVDTMGQGVNNNPAQ